MELVTGYGLQVGLCEVAVNDIVSVVTMVTVVSVVRRRHQTPEERLET